MNKFLPILLLAVATVSGCTSAPRPMLPQQPQGGYEVQKGTQKPYRIDGKWYTPVASSYGFEETGIASWYGRDFHGKNTSNGERYDMHAMTAAHKTLPMSTYVRVTRLDNGRETIVRVNDRGPFVKGRIIDLSYSAAKEIGIADEGTARVRITALGSKQGNRLVASDYSRGSFYVQVGAFTVKKNAEALRVRLEREYGRATLSEFDTGGKRFYRARIGPVEGMAEAEVLLKRASDDGFPDSYVVGD